MWTTSGSLRVPWLAPKVCALLNAVLFCFPMKVEGSFRSRAMSVACG